eukprot:360699-Chlamydomonas_euryale.AAC.1
MKGQRSARRGQGAPSNACLLCLSSVVLRSSDASARWHAHASPRRLPRTGGRLAAADPPAAMFRGALPGDRLAPHSLLMIASSRCAVAA